MVAIKANLSLSRVGRNQKTSGPQRAKPARAFPGRRDGLVRFHEMSVAGTTPPPAIASAKAGIQAQRRHHPNQEQARPGAVRANGQRRAESAIA